MGRSGPRHERRLRLAGSKFGRLTAIKDVGRNRHGRRLWECKCDCGGESVVTSSKLKNGHTQSCGCAQMEGAFNARWKGGQQNRGSEAWANARISNDRKTARKAGHAPMAITGLGLSTLFQAHDQCCDICGISEEEYGRELHIDHCHNTGLVRGFLCAHCNQGIGLLKESSELMLAAIEYLKRNDSGTLKISSG